MSFRTRFILLALFNCVLLGAFFWLAAKFGADLSQRLVDLNLETQRGLFTFVAFIAGIVAGFLGNFLLLASRKSEFTYDQVATLLKAARTSA
jgi:hypothetical protein